jgi:hypothetical protein
MIEEESLNSTQRKLGDDDTKLLSKGDKKLQGAKPGDKSKPSPKGSNLTSPRD